MSYHIKLYSRGGSYLGWLQSYDPEVHGHDPYPTGEIKATWHAAEAMTFATRADAVACWQQQSKTHPLRPDGEPNRPLTLFTVEIEDV